MCKLPIDSDPPSRPRDGVFGKMLHTGFFARFSAIPRQTPDSRNHIPPDHVSPNPACDSHHSTSASTSARPHTPHFTTYPTSLLTPHSPPHTASSPPFSPQRQASHQTLHSCLGLPQKYFYGIIKSWAPLTRQHPHVRGSLHPFPHSTSFPIPQVYSKKFL